MKLREFLKGLTLDELKEIGRELRGVSVFNGTGRKFLEKKIIENLTSLDYLNKMIEKMEKTCNIALTQLVYFNFCSDSQSLSVLRKKGLVYQEMLVPEDIKELLKDCLYHKIRKKYSREWEVRQTPFMNLILLTGLIQRDEIKIKKLKNNGLKPSLNAEYKEAYRHLQGTFLKLLIDFLENQGIVYWVEKDMVINKVEFKKWVKKDNFTKFELLYRWLDSKNIKVLKMVSALSKLQINFEDWIDIRVIIEEDILKTKEAIEKLGLIRFKEIDENYYVKLTPEGWYYINRIYPDYWYNECVLISADFEVLIPHDFDPNLIALLDMYGKLKENDYFLVFDIEPTNLNEEFIENDQESYRTFIRELKLKSVYMPQVVDYELSEFLRT
ncbi:hypothetical protein [Natranaerobius trueperi]|uniref:Helicase XPB/Ssl2 N-terminal domain-containing protein n=1 Tax=Natranaerobius trueperi TaxID=759412 RepID=A0A226BWS9_9FIRM|nr:hypothetical protein [Natranaerobius trueperi]OWZ83371.1 hypothetical protein CDO51_09125 [Natranaerobius trueperi]